MGIQEFRSRMTAKMASQTKSENKEAQASPSAVAHAWSGYSLPETSITPRNMSTEAVAVAPTIVEETSAGLTSPEKPADCLACFVAYTVEVFARQDTCLHRHTACHPCPGTAYQAASGRWADADERLAIEMGGVADSG